MVPFLSVIPKLLSNLGDNWPCKNLPSLSISMAEATAPLNFGLLLLPSLLFKINGYAIYNRGIPSTDSITGLRYDLSVSLGLEK